MKSNFEIFKNREFLGDKLLDVVFSDILLEKGLTRNEVNIQLKSYTNNDFLRTIYVKLNLEINPHDKTVDVSKRKANAVEEYFWNFFLEKGYHCLKNKLTDLI